jgi:sulfur carrier protein ThiS
MLDDEEHPWREGMTVTDLLEGIKNSQRYAVVKVNNTYVSKPHFDTFVIPDEAIIFLIPMIAGG